MLQFIQNMERQQEEINKRKARFVSEYRGQLVRIPLQHRTKVEPEERQSFILKEVD